jgi:stage V sporulation protein B
MSDDDIDELSPFNTARGTLYLISKASISGVLNAVFFIFIARFLPHVSDLGLFQGLQSLITISVTLAGSGLSRAAIRFISMYIGAGKERMAEAIYSSVFRIGLISSIVLSLVLYILAYYIAILFFHNIKYITLIHLASIDIFLSSMIIYSISLLYALQSFRKAVMISILNSLLKYTLAFILLLIGMGIIGIIIGFIIGDAAGLAVFLYTLLPKIRKSPASIREMRPLFSYSIPLYGYSVLFYLSTELDIYLLLILSSLSVVGIYSPAVFLGAILFLVLTSLDQSLAPLFSRVYGKSGINSLQNLSKFASRYIFLIFLPIGFTVLASAPVILTGVLGERYSDSIYPATIIILVITSVPMTPVFNNILMSSGHTRVFLKFAMVALSVQLVISFITIPSIGGLGAAIARSSSYAILFLYPAYKLRQITGLHYDRNALKKGLIGSAILGSILFCLNFYLPHPYYLPFNLVVVFMSYLLFLRFTNAVNIKDIEVINKILAGKAKWLMTIIMKVVIR